MIKPVTANNTYAISRPNTLIKMINYATKTSGQGITIGATEQKFSFDEALALVALRGLMPVVNMPIYSAGTTTANSANILPGVIPNFQSVHVSNGGGDMDISSAVLRAILHPTELP